MKDMLNIALDDEHPLFVDPASITALDMPAKGEMRIFTAEGCVLHIVTDEWNVDADDAVRKINGSRAALVPFTPRLSDRAFPGYIAPGAVAFVTYAMPDEDGHVAAIVGVNGVGWITTTHTTQADIDVVLDAVRKSKQVLCYANEDVSARFFNPAGLYVDPAAVAYIRDDHAGQLTVQFARCASLDITPHCMPLDDAIRHISKKTGEQDSFKLMNEASRMREAQMERGRALFTRSVTGLSGGLIAIPASGQFNSVRPGSIRSVRVFENNRGFYIGLYPEATSHDPHALPIQIAFRTNAERAGAIDALKQAFAKPPVPNGKHKPLLH